MSSVCDAGGWRPVSPEQKGQQLRAVRLLQSGIHQGQATGSPGGWVVYVWLDG